MIYIDQIVYTHCLISNLGIEFCKMISISIKVKIELIKNMHIKEVYATTKAEIEDY